MDWFRPFKQTKLDNQKSGGSVPVYRNVHRTWFKKPDDYRKNNGNSIRNRNYKYIQSVIASGICLSFSPLNAFAADVGGVSATANPVANSSGSVTNQAIQVLQGPYITNQYGDGISCQGPTLNLTPFVTGSLSQGHPFETMYDDPVYNNADNNDDGIPDNPGEILYYIPTRTGQKNNTNVSVGLSATLSIPLDKKAQRLCKEAVQHHNEYRSQLLANKRLDFEIARLKNCGELLQKGIMFHPKSPYYKVWADVVVMNKNAIAPHKHSIPSPSTSESRVSESAADLGAPLQTRPLRLSP